MWLWQEEIVIMTKTFEKSLIGHLKRWRNELRPGSGIRFDIKKVCIRERLSSSDQDPVFISKEVVEDLLKVQKIYAEKQGYYTSQGAWNQLPLVFLLGQKANVIKTIELIRTQGGCGYMPNVKSDVINKGMFKLIKRGYFVAGFARVGFTEKVGTDNTDNRFGEGLNMLLRFSSDQGLVFVSLTQFHFNVQMPNEKRSNYINANYQIINERRKKSCQIRSLARLAAPLQVGTVKAGTTLKDFLSTKSLNYSSSVRVNGQVSTATYKLKNGDIITTATAVQGG